MILTDDERERIARPFVRTIGGDHWYSGDDGIRDDGDIEKFAAALESAVLRKLREREPSGYLIDWPGEPDLGDYFAYEPSGCGRSRPLHIIQEVNE